jgi:hypothetical protein
MRLALMVRPYASQLALIAPLGGVSTGSPLLAQQQGPIGTVGVQDATVSGALEITNGRAILVGSNTVTARDHTAEVALKRGGKVLVCATSGLHLTAGKSAASNQPLMLALDRGAIEVQMDATASDVVLTPDLRLAIQGSGPLDLRLRVTRNGDTCVENRGIKAPTLHISDQFGEASYDIRPGQHVLFEHASLKEVVDRETSPCGCPPDPVVSVADAGVTSSTPATPGSGVADQHPFPAAVSQGLAPAPAVPAAPAGEVHAQVSTTLNFDSSGPPTPPPSVSSSGASTSPASTASQPVVVQPAAPAAQTAPAEVRAEAPLPPAPPSATTIGHRIGHFFKRLFGRG